MSEQKKWNPTDPKHFVGKSRNELESLLKKAEESAKKHSQFQFGWHNEYRQELKRRIAMTIGVK